MRTAIVIDIAALTSLAAINAVSAVSNHYVRGYTARNGTSSSLTSKRTPNATKFDNWPTRGNINLYTGKAGTKSPFETDDINTTDKPILRRLSGRLFLLLLLAALMRPAVGETIQLERSEHGTYTISVQINGALVLPFVLDTGASLVVIPEDVFRTLTRTGTVTKSDFIGAGTAVLADGFKHASDSYVLHEVQVGDHIMRNVVASVVSVNGAALLGQSFLSKLPAWSIDNTRQALVIADGAGATPSTPAAPATTPVSPALSQYGAIAWDEGTGKRGWSLNQDTPQRAAEVALGACGTAGCKVIVRTGPAMCSALAATENSKYIGAASRADRIDARFAALANCQKGNAGECAIQLMTCNQ